MGKGLGTGMLDKMVHGAFLGKRQLGRPLKYNFRTRGKAGYVFYYSTNIRSLREFKQLSGIPRSCVFDLIFILEHYLITLMIFNIDGLN